MAFTDEQRAALKAKLSYRHVRNRLSEGIMIPYVEGWHVIAEANRIFGHDGWDRTTIEPRCIWRDTQRGQTTCFYTAKVCIRVTANGSTIVREGMGTGTGRSSAPEIAHEIALKSAETDATKRALATFGNPFGLALYDKARLQVTRSRRKATEARQHETSGASESYKTSAPSEFVLLEEDGRRVHIERAEDFVDAVLKRVPSLATLEVLYAFWVANIESMSLLRWGAGARGPAQLLSLIEALKERAREIGRSGTERSRQDTGAAEGPNAHDDCGATSQPGSSMHTDAARQAVAAITARRSVAADPEVDANLGIDYGVAANGSEGAGLAKAGHEMAMSRPEVAKDESDGVLPDLRIPKEKRIRSKDHLEFVARQPCLVCGRRPAQAHHLRFAQPRAMSLKVSDEFTLPLCAGHHDELHRAGDERAWWARQGIRAPLEIAARLWSASRRGSEGNGASAPAAKA